MIIQIRGTSGSGKSTVMKQVMQRLGEPEVQYVSGRRRPQQYFFNGLIYVLGHYETPCGGCDTIGSAKAVYDLIQQLIHGPANARHILCEGLLLSEDVKWSSQLKDIRVVYLTTPIERCLRQIRARREAAGNTKPLSESNTRNRVRVIERSRDRLLQFGIPCYRWSVNQATNKIIEMLDHAN